MYSLPREHQKQVGQIVEFFQRHFHTNDSNKVSEGQVREMLESSVFRQYLFSDSGACIIHHSTFTYRYISESTENLIGLSRAELFEKGPAAVAALMHPDDLGSLHAVFDEAKNRLLSVPLEDRIHVHFSYSCRYNTQRGVIGVYQVNIPLALSHSGLPYLMLILTSNITEYSRGAGVKYRLSLNKPGKPVEILYSGATVELASPLTEREKQVVRNMAEGMDASEIAKTMFISEGTVRTHRKNILEKTGAKNSVHLVRMAVANGWI